MSKYYTIAGLKVRVSDHEPNHSMNRFRGINDIEFYTQDIERKPLSVVSQIEYYCEDNDLDIELFSEIIKDFPDPPPTPFFVLDNTPEVVTQEFIDAYNSIGKKRRSTRQYDLCNEFGYCWNKIRFGEYIIK